MSASKADCKKDPQFHRYFFFLNSDRSKLKDSNIISPKIKYNSLFVIDRESYLFKKFCNLLCISKPGIWKKGYFVFLRILFKKSCLNENSKLAKHVITSDLDIRDYVRKVLLIEALIFKKMITCNLTYKKAAKKLRLFCELKMFESVKKTQSYLSIL